MSSVLRARFSALLRRLQVVLAVVAVAKEILVVEEAMGEVTVCEVDEMEAEAEAEAEAEVEAEAEAEAEEGWAGEQ